MSGSMRWETSQFWEQLRFANVDGYTFMPRRMSGYGLAKSRNYLTYLARQSNCGLLLNMDSDVEPTLEHVMRLVSHKVEAVSGLYPKKMIDHLEWVGNVVYGGERKGDLVEAYDFGGGFSLFDMNAIDRLVEHYHAETWYESEDSDTKGHIMHDLWSNGPVIDNWRGRVFSRYLTEDFFMCYRLRMMGIKTWLDPQCQVGHIGTVDFAKLHLKIQEIEAASIRRAPTD
jgi:hypothetical protein